MNLGILLFPDINNSCFYFSNMKCQNRIFVLFFLLLIVSCNQKGRDSRLSFPSEFSIASRKLPVDTYKISSFGRIVLFEDSSCLIKENLMGESLLDKIYYKKDSLSSFAKVGAGPDEYIMLRLMQKNDTSGIMALDIQKRQLITKDLSGTTHDVLNIDGSPLSIIQAGNGYVVSGLLDRSSDDTKRYALLNHEGKYLCSFGDFPNDKNNTDVQSKVLAYQDNLVYNPVLNRFASACSSGFIFELFQMDTIPRLLQSYHKIYPKYIKDSGAGYNSIRHKRDNIIGFTDLYATPRFIYALYSGKRLEEYSNSGMMEAKLTHDILVYNWDGICMGRLVTDVALFNISVADNDREVIALGWDNDFYLYSFDIEEIMNAMGSS